MYYIVIILAVVMFGGCFALNDAYRKLRTSSLSSSVESSFIGAVAGLVVLLAVSGFDFQATPFTCCVALLSALCGIGFMFCSLKALDTVNLSLFSLFSMLGGMVLPFFQGLIFYGEKITIAKIVCITFICIALGFTVSPDKTRSNTAYYVGVFVLNGMSGVLSKIFASAPFEKTNAEWYSIWSAVFTAIISGALWLLLSKKECGYTWKAFGIGALNGAINRFANFLLVIALLHVEASVQYPLVTGGVIIASTIICYFGKIKPSPKEILSVIFAFLGMLALFLIKI